MKQPIANAPCPKLPCHGPVSGRSARAWLAIAVVCLLSTGCMGHVARISSACNAVPVKSLPPEVLNARRGDKLPIDFALLKQNAPEWHRIDAGDTLGVFVEGVTVLKEEAEVLRAPSLGFTSLPTTNDPYPSTGLVRVPVMGLPMQVDDGGRLDLPLVGLVFVQGMSLQQATDALRRAYGFDRALLHAGQDQIVVSLIKARTHRVLVIREDVNGSQIPSYRFPRAAPFTKRGSSAAVDLPTAENDVLHALMASGGLPGIDAFSEVWVVRSHALSEEASAPGNSQGNSLRAVLRIPLRTARGEPLLFSKDDIVLHDGDIVYLRSRDDEVFFTGGLLPGGVFSLPRDRDINVVQAMAIATASAGGPAGALGKSMNFRAAAQGGIINPTRALIVRQMPSGEQIKISIDLSDATRSGGAGLILLPNDFLMLQYKPSEYAGNLALSLFRFNIFITNEQQRNNAAATTAGTAGTGTPPGGEAGGTTP